MYVYKEYLQEVSLGFVDTTTSSLEIINCLVHKAGFSKEFVSSDLRGSTAGRYQRKWSRFFHWCRGWYISLHKATIPQTAESLFLQRGLKLSVPAVKGYCAALNHVFSLAGKDLATNRIISSFQKTCPPRNVKPPEQNLSLVLRSLTHLPNESPKLFLDKHLTWKMCFLLALTSAKRVRELHGLSFHVCRSQGWKSAPSPDFVAKNQNP